MAAPYSGKLKTFLSIGNCCRWDIGNIVPSFKICETFQVRNYAARKGTREKARKKKVKVEQKKVGFIPHNLRQKHKLKLPPKSKRLEDSWKAVATDNVWVAKYYRWRLYSFAEAVECHRETHHPTVYNVPNACLSVFIELNMHAAKKTKFIDQFSRMVSLPYPYDHGEDRSILAFCKTAEMQKVAFDAGATLAGGPELIKDIQSGQLSLQDFQYIVSHPDILPELVAVRGLMKRRFPGPGNGTLDPDVAKIISRFRHGIKYSASRDEHELDYGWIDTSIGTLDMDVSHLEANLKALLQDIDSVRPKREGDFITRLLLVSPPSVERLKVEYEPYLTERAGVESDSIDEENEEDDVKKTVAVG